MEFAEFLKFFSKTAREDGLLSTFCLKLLKIKSYIETILSSENFRKCSFPFLFINESGSSFSGRNRKDIFLFGCNSFIEFSAALNAAFLPLVSLSKQIITSVSYTHLKLPTKAKV